MAIRKESSEKVHQTGFIEKQNEVIEEGRRVQRMSRREEGKWYFQKKGTRVWQSRRR